MAAFNQLFGVVLIHIEALGLYIGAIAAVLIGAFVPLYTEPFKGIIQILQRLIVITLAVGIFHPQDKGASLRPGEKIVEKGGSYTTDVLQTGRRRGIPYT